ncbi:MAG: alpha/beta hydrolase fold domain-containing protein [Gemmataceae bacterium]|nr:alpha/beta hydrolase fold domain-containing protein [Gemmataceae bacterium]
MKPVHLLAALLFVGFFTTPTARSAEDVKAVIKTGGDFEVEIVKDVAYYEGDDADANKHKLDLYLPNGHKDYPVLFFVHGGSWRGGDRKQYGPLGNVFAKNGVGVVAISYRLSPKVQHPEHSKDVARAFAWTHKNIAKHGGKSDQIFVSGHSAGGHLAALLATDQTYLRAHKLELSNIKGVIAMSGVYVLVANRIFESAFGKDEEVVKNAAPIKHVKENLCPFCLIYADKDFTTLDAMAEQFCKELKSCKCEAQTIKMPDRTHMTIIIKCATSEEDPTTQAMLEFIARHSSLKLKAKAMK